MSNLTEPDSDRLAAKPLPEFEIPQRITNSSETRKLVQAKWEPARQTANDHKRHKSWWHGK